MRPAAALFRLQLVTVVLKNSRRAVAGGKTAEELLKLAMCCFRHAKIATNAAAAENLREVGENLLDKARRLDPAIKRPQ
jgi:hypothetical protein